MKNNRYIIPRVTAVDLEGECLFAGSPDPEEGMHEGYQEVANTQTISWGEWNPTPASNQ